MSDEKKITGRVEIFVNGMLLLNKAGARITGLGLSGQPARERRPIMGDTGIHGFTEDPIAAMCEVTVTDRKDILLDDLMNINGDGTIVFQAAGGNGKKYVMDNVTCLLNAELTAGEGEVTLRYAGMRWTELV